jgi:hypothetical protein
MILFFILLLLILFVLLQIKKKEIYKIENFSNDYKIYISLTTIPERINNIRTILDSLISQNQKFEKILFNVPNYSKRFKTKYNIPNFLKDEKYKKYVKVITCEDYGPGTKLLGCLDYLDNLKTNKEIYVIIIDDDRIIDKSLLTSLIRKQVENKNCIIANKGSNQQLKVKIPWGAGGISIPYKLIDNKNIKSFFKKHENKCRYVDDVFWYKYFVNKKNIKIIYHEKVKLNKETNNNNPLYKEKGLLQRYNKDKQKGLNELCFNN